MERLEYLFQEWHRLGGAVLLARIEPAIHARAPEIVIAESTAHCRESGRLTWVVLDWLVREIDRINPEKLLAATRAQGDSAVLGVLCDAARQRRAHPFFDQLIAACAPRAHIEPFFDRVARSPLALQETRAQPNPIFLRWNFLSNELRYLTAQVTEMN
ncbi:MAG: hypothetical protein HZC40_12225 [Chloroflexi bacterium]|nr:hypothetical protein [Chloroflexota bacterium]